MKSFLSENGRLLVVTLLSLTAGIFIGICIGQARGNFASDATNPDANARIDAATWMTRVVYFEACGHEQHIDMDANAYIGYNREDLSRLYADASVSAFSRQAVRVFEVNSGFCPRHFVLRARSDGTLGVMQADRTYFTEEVVLLLPDETAHIAADELRQLKDGIAFDSLPEIDAYLENLGS